MVARELCGKHYQRWLKYGDAEYEVGHYGCNQGKKCGAKACDSPATIRGYCQNHYQIWKRHGDADHPVINRPGKGRGKGWHEENGYIAVKVGRKNIRQHRIVMENMIGRKLKPNENVHHKNGNRADNRPENLELWTSHQPWGQRPEDLVQYALEILFQYGDESIRELLEQYKPAQEEAPIKIIDGHAVLDVDSSHSN